MDSILRQNPGSQFSSSLQHTFKQLGHLYSALEIYFFFLTLLVLWEFYIVCFDHIQPTPPTSPRFIPFHSHPNLCSFSFFIQYIFNHISTWQHQNIRLSPEPFHVWPLWSCRSDSQEATGSICLTIHSSDLTCGFSHHIGSNRSHRLAPS